MAMTSVNPRNLNTILEKSSDLGKNLRAIGKSGKERNDGSPSDSPGPANRSASEESQRLKLFEEWLRYEHRVKDGYVVFETTQGWTSSKLEDTEKNNGVDDPNKDVLHPYVQFSFAQKKRGIVAEIGTAQWMDMFGTPMPDSINNLLSENGFQPPDSKHGPNHWQELSEFDPGSLSDMTEWAFNQIFGYLGDEDFAVKVAEFA